MYNVFLVDDEALVVKSLIASIDWAAHGFQVAGYALNGVEALTAIDATKPDLVFTDIRMPGMSGLELIKQLNEASSPALMIVISGYAEFALAQKAINYGAFGYCLKPFNENEIVPFLKKARKALEERDRRRKPDLAALIESDDPEMLAQLQGLLAEKHKQADRGGQPQSGNRTFHAIRAYIDEHYREELTIPTLAKTFNVNGNYISQLFKRENSQTFTEYVTRLRIEYACELLTSTDLTISEVAEKSGYGDYFYFSRIFKRLKGKTPSDYRSGSWKRKIE